MSTSNTTEAQSNSKMPNDCFRGLDTITIFHQAKKNYDDDNKKMTTASLLLRSLLHNTSAKPPTKDDENSEDDDFPFILQMPIEKRPRESSSSEGTFTTLNKKRLHNTKHKPHLRLRPSRQIPGVPLPVSFADEETTGYIPLSSSALPHNFNMRSNKKQRKQDMISLPMIPDDFWFGIDDELGCDGVVPPNSTTPTTPTTKESNSNSVPATIANGTSGEPAFSGCLTPPCKIETIDFNLTFLR